MVEIAFSYYDLYMAVVSLVCAYMFTTLFAIHLLGKKLQGDTLLVKNVNAAAVAFMGIFAFQGAVFFFTHQAECNLIFLGWEKEIGRFVSGISWNLW